MIYIKKAIILLIKRRGLRAKLPNVNLFYIPSNLSAISTASVALGAKESAPID